MANTPIIIGAGMGGLASGIYGQRVDQILTKNNKAVGVRLADGTEHRADLVISDADGRKTILNLLEGKYMDEKIKGYCAEPAAETSKARSSSRSRDQATDDYPLETPILRYFSPFFSSSRVRPAYASAVATSRG